MKKDCLDSMNLEDNDFVALLENNFGRDYLRISKKISLTLNFIKDKLLSEQDVMKRAEEIQSEMSQANEIGSQFPTNQGDYDKAKSGIQNGEENYTEEELDLWE